MCRYVFRIFWISILAFQLRGRVLADQYRPGDQYGPWDEDCYAVAVSGKYAFLGEGDCVAVIDVSNSRLPRKISHIRVAPGTVKTINRIRINDNMAYVASLGGPMDSGEGTILNMMNPAKPMVVSTIPTEEDSLDVGMKSNVLYLLTRSSLYVYDIREVTHPKKMAALPVSGGEGIYVCGNYAYVALYGEGVEIIDIGNPNTPHVLSTCLAKKAKVTRSVVVSGTVAYIASEKLSEYESEGGLSIFDVSNPNVPRMLGSFVSGKTLEMNGDGIAISDNRAFLTDYYGYKMHIFDVRNPAKPLLLSSFSTSGQPSQVAVMKNIAYLACRTGGLQIVDVKNPTNPSLLGQYATLNYANDTMELIRERERERRRERMQFPPAEPNVKDKDNK
jgi:hypothetical protein